MAKKKGFLMTKKINEKYLNINNCKMEKKRTTDENLVNYSVEMFN